MEKTVVIVCGNTLSSDQGGDSIAIDLKVGNRSGGPTYVSKSMWTCCVEAVMEYCRIIFDLFPDQYQVTHMYVCVTCIYTCMYIFKGVCSCS